MKLSFVQNWFAEHASGRRVLLAFIVTFVGTSWFGYLHLELIELVGEDAAKIPDTMPWVTPDILFGTFAELGEKGREFYLEGLYTDFVYPLTYWVFMGLLYSLAVRTSGQHGTRLIWFPTTLMLCDQVENVAFLLCVDAVPEEAWWIALVGSVAHMGKWLLGLPSVLLMFRCAWEVLRPKKRG